MNSAQINKGKSMKDASQAADPTEVEGVVLLSFSVIDGLFYLVYLVYLNYFYEIHTV